MQERKDLIGLTRLADCQVQVKKSNGQLTPEFAWALTALIEFSRQPNISIKTRQKTEGYMDRFNISDDLADKLIEVRQGIISAHTIGSNLKQAGRERMSLFLMEKYQL